MHNICAFIAGFIGPIRSIAIDPLFRRIFFALLICDSLLMLLHVAVSIAPWLAQEIGDIASFDERLQLRIDHEDSYSENFEYIKSLLCVICLYRCYVHTRSGIYIAIAIIYALVFADNAFGLHEHIGALLKQGLPSVGQNKGEFAAFLLYLIAIVGLLWWSFPALSSEHAAYAVGCLICIGIIAFFAIGIDVLTAVVPRAVPHTYEALTLLEDGGELIALSLNLAFVGSLAQRLKDRNEQKGTYLTFS